MASEDRKEEEAHFHDHLREEAPYQRWTPEAEAELGADAQWRNFKFYAIERRSRAVAEEWLISRAPGKRFLDLGCGNGDDAILIAKAGGEVVGIDLSSVAVENSTAAAEAAGVGDRCRFEVMDAEKMTFPDASFDYVSIYGVMHHLAIEGAMNEIRRVLAVDGQALFTEALAHNKLIRLYRDRTPDLRTRWEAEHILRLPDIETMHRWFEDVDVRYYHLATLLAVPFRNRKSFDRVLSATERIDDVLFRVPTLRRQAWQAVIQLSRPRPQPLG